MSRRWTAKLLMVLLVIVARANAQQETTPSGPQFVTCRKWLEMRNAAEQLRNEPSAAGDPEVIAAIRNLKEVDQYLTGYTRGWIESRLISSPFADRLKRVSSPLALAGLVTVCADHLDAVIVTAVVEVVASYMETETPK